jgi:hypothetical protein
LLKKLKCEQTRRSATNSALAKAAWGPEGDNSLTTSGQFLDYGHPQDLAALASKTKTKASAMSGSITLA